MEARLPLHLVYNLRGPVLPADEAGLESDYEQALKERLAGRGSSCGGALVPT